MGIRALLALVLVIATFTAMANAGKLTSILQQQREIRQQSEVSTGSYARFERAELERMHHAQDRIFELLKGVHDIDQLNPAQQSELFNAIEEVKAVISRNEDDRQMCWREHQLGSSIKKTLCATVAERRTIREGGQEWKGKPSICQSLGEGMDCGGNIR